ncbi:ROK family transcriptional regulator [Solirubrobacter sp. CPCC 204708]|uniref:ROK family transcriptional regulator n=1 Tax=Solirubrobacter deserti TaxID=2282478 RepID=A0ABT4RJI0_9ACTN|nr:ROK family transcriptional regulator [Solirubrobacter deserti]MBE2320795.1 ROK family transcriptional regulator [Solirubrobacter deserti]MDA0138430.1 ROK family transcriptional regulator [Solirubrobacter deserti]
MSLNESPTPSVRHANRVRMLHALLRHPARSRADLGRSLGLSRATVTALLHELEVAGMVEQQRYELDDERPPAIGRPPLQVSLAPRAAYAVGLDFGHRHVRSAVCDLGGRIVGDQWAANDTDTHPLSSFDVAHRLTSAALAEAGVSPAHVVGAGVGLAAPVDAVTGLIYAEGVLPRWDGVQPAAELERRLGLPVQVVNDANAGAMGEHLFGAGRGVSDLVYLQLSGGVGLGLILNGESYGGVAGVAGELGHTPVIEDGLICRCGNRGCLETLATSDAVADLLGRSRGEAMTFARVLELLESGDRGARRAVTDTGAAVGRAIAGVVNLLNPELVIIGGELAAAGDTLLEPIREAVDRRAILPAARAVRVVRGSLGEHAEVLGAAAVQLARAPEALAGRLANIA